MLQQSDVFLHWQIWKVTCVRHNCFTISIFLNQHLVSPRQLHDARGVVFPHLHERSRQDYLSTQELQQIELLCRQIIPFLLLTAKRA